MSRRIRDDDNLWRYVWGTRFSDRAPFLFTAVFALITATYLTMPYSSQTADRPRDNGSIVSESNSLRDNPPYNQAREYLSMQERRQR